MEAFVIVVAIVILVVVGIRLRGQRKRAAEMDLEDKSWLRPPEPESDPLTRRAPVREFHIAGSEARVSFDVPLGVDDDPILNELLIDEAVEVLREKRHTLPLEEVHEIVVFAGRGETKEIGRTKLPSPGQLPPPVSAEILNFSHVAKDPFASQFEVDYAIQEIETTTTVPEDDLARLQDELRVPAGLDRGLRARGIDPDAVSGPEFVLAVLELFDYKVVPSGEAGVYVATKENVQTFIRTVAHEPGSYPELDEDVIRKFVVEFGTSGAQRGLLITDKYGPYLANDVERHEPRIRFITRERSQRFIDSMAMG